MGESKRAYVVAAGALLIALAALLSFFELTRIYERASEPHNAASKACAHLVPPETAETPQYSRCLNRELERPPVRWPGIAPPLITGALGALVLTLGLRTRPRQPDGGVHSEQ